jgi:hypothetical protein
MILGLLSYDIAKVKASDPWAVDEIARTKYAGDKTSARKFLAEMDPKQYISRKAASVVPGSLLGLGWLKAGGGSAYSGDYSRIDDVGKLIRDYLTHPRDCFLPVLKVDNEVEVGKVSNWVKVAQTQFFEEVVSETRERCDELWELLNGDKLGVMDVTEKIVTSVDRAKEKVKKVRLALVTFRLENEFKDFIEAKMAEADALKDDLLARLLTVDKQMRVAKAEKAGATA